MILFGQGTRYSTRVRFGVWETLIMIVLVSEIISMKVLEYPQQRES